MALWNTNFNTTPPNTDTPKRAAAMIRELKLAIYNRIGLEHENFNSGTDGGASNDWWHKEGSAKSYIGDYGGFASFVGPTTRPDGITELDENDAGRTCVDTNGGSYQQYIWSGTAWVAMGGLPIGSLYVQLAGQAAPSTILPGTWTNVSSSYAGRFFRAEGGNAVAFSGVSTSGSNQADDNKPHNHSTTISGMISGSGTQTGFVWRSNYEGYNNYDPSFTASTSGSTESRPVNSTIRIWKRTA